jgi:YD repeat-containing protein
VQPGPDGVLYVDDIRMHPRDASMQTFVYEPRLKQLIARHDENNLAMRWQYDQAGRLRVSERETERGWRTVTEHMSHQAEYR